MSLVVDELEGSVMESLPGETDEENADYLRELVRRLQLSAEDLDPTGSPVTDQLREFAQRHELAVAYLDRGVFTAALDRDLTDDEWDRVKYDLDGYDEWLDNSGARDSISFYVSMLLEKHGVTNED